jgi:putative transposase
LNNIEHLENRFLKIDNRSFSQNITDEKEIGKLVVRQLKRLFITYSMAINNQEKRSGNLFDPKYKRLEITNQDYLEYAIFYTHFNPEKHGITNDFKDYRYSSYCAFLSSSETSIDRKLVLELFGGKSEFINYHRVMHDDRDSIILE